MIDRNGRVSAYEPVSEPWYAVPKLIDERERKHPMYVGTVLRSTHSGDVLDGKRQHRVVVGVTDNHVYVATKEHGRMLRESRIRRASSGKVTGHEVVTA